MTTPSGASAPAPAAAATTSTKKVGGGTGYITTLALVMMNVTIVASLANDVQQAFYGLSSVTLFIVGALVFFLPTGLVAAELASGWSERGGIFRWVGEAMGKGWAFTCLLILWFQTTFMFGSGIPSASATIMFYTPHFDEAVKFAQHPKHQLLFMCGWLVYYWVVCWVATKGVKAFAGIAKYGVLLGTFLPLTVMTILAVIWIAKGNTPHIEFTPKGLLPPWHGMATLALAAGVLFSFAGIDMNAAHIKQLKNPRRQFPAAMFIAMILALLIFIVGTLIIAIVIPNKDINVLYTLFATYRELGATIGMPWLYLVFVYLGLGASLAGLITNLAGPSYMLGQAGRSGLLPKQLQNNNKHGMPSKLMYLQMGGMTAIAFIVFLLPNVEGFVILVTQAVTILYMLYYILMFVSFLKLRYEQPNRPRTFKIPGGMAGAWGIAVTGLVACVFGIVLALYPPAQVKSEVGSGATYVTIIVAIIAVVLAACFGLYRASKKHDWVDPSNQFAPFTWQIEGLKKPERVLSNVPTEMMSADQSPMGMPIKRPYPPDERIILPPEFQDIKHKGEPTPAELAAQHSGTGSGGTGSGGAGSGGTATAVATAPSTTTTTTAGASVPAAPATPAAPAAPAEPATRATPAAAPAPAAPSPAVPPASSADVAATVLPTDPAAAADAARRAAQEAAEKAKNLEVAAAALAAEADADAKLAQAQRDAQAATAAAIQAELAAGITTSADPAAPAAQADPADPADPDTTPDAGPDNTPSTKPDTPAS